jgi:methionyl-tRNA formyltransferase
MDYSDKNIALATHGSVGICAIRKLFSLRIKPEKIVVLTYDPFGSDNRTLMEFLSCFNIPWFTPKSDMQFLFSILKTKDVSLLLNVGYKYIYCEPVLGMENVILINMHPGILPYYRGWLSTPWSIFNNEKYAGYTYHIIAKEVDKGDIILTGEVSITDASTAFDLHFLLHERALSRLDYIISGRWGTRPQIGEGGYYKKEFPNGGYINTGWDDEKIDRFIRAMYFPPHKGALLNTSEGVIEISNFKEYLKVKRDGKI